MSCALSLLRDEQVRAEPIPDEEATNNRRERGGEAGARQSTGGDRLV
jgi:hypothetical protein